MSVRVWNVVLGSLAAGGCLQKFELPPSESQAGAAGSQSSSASGSDAGSTPAPPPCGDRGEDCCNEPEPACAPGLRCDDAARLCVTEEPRLCETDEQCHPGQTCCVAGLLGNCVTLAPGSACPAPDLVIVSTQESLAFTREERRFDPENPSDACAIEKGCVGGPGLRQLLRFSVKVENQGDADLIIGDPTRSPEFQAAQCDGQPYFPNYLSYELVEIVSGAEVPGARGRVEAQCQELPAGFSSRFSCSFRGLWSGFSESYVPTSLAEPPFGSAPDCQWIDITGVPANDYELRVTVNPEGKLREPSSGNSQNFAVTLPTLDDPLQACPAPPDPNTPPNGGASLLGYGTQLECGWLSGPPATCESGATVTLGCACDGSEGDPMIRVCEGSAACSSGAALTAGHDTVRLRDYSDNTLGEEDLSNVECDARIAEVIAASPNGFYNYYCEPVSACPLVRFTCPASETYTVLLSSSYPAWNTPVTCEVTPQPANAGGNVTP